MHRMCLVVAVAVAFGAVVAAAEEPSGRPGANQPGANQPGANQPEANQPATPAVPPASGTLSSDLNRSGGVITPPSGIDPEIKQTPPPTGARMPIIPPPGTPGGNPTVKPK